MDLHNQNSDTARALEAIDLACDLARDEGIKEKLAKDRKQLTDIRKEQESHNAVVQIRDDVIEVTRDHFRHNSTILPARDIDAIRFGIFIQTTNGIRTVSYLIAVRSSSHGTVELECKRWFRGEEQAKRDFNAILQAMYYQIIPGLCERIVGRVMGGIEVPLGDCHLRADGIRAPTGMLFWKDEQVVPWDAVRFGIHQGHLNISSAGNSKVSKSLSLRDVWNAVIFEDVAKGIVAERAKK